MLSDKVMIPKDCRVSVTKTAQFPRKPTVVLVESVRVSRIQYVVFPTVGGSKIDGSKMGCPEDLHFLAGMVNVLLGSISITS